MCFVVSGSMQKNSAQAEAIPIFPMSQAWLAQLNNSSVRWTYRGASVVKRKTGFAKKGRNQTRGANEFDIELALEGISDNRSTGEILIIGTGSYTKHNRHV